MFSGKDASRAIAKWSMSEEDLNDNLVRKVYETRDLHCDVISLQ